MALSDENMYLRRMWRTRRLSASLCLVLSLLLLPSRCEGQVDISCDTLLPNTANAVAQTSRPPYRITVAPEHYTPESIVMVSVVATNTAARIVGFMLQARRADSQLTSPVGRFMSAPAPATRRQCGDQSDDTVTHFGDSLTGVSVVWQAPASGVGNVQFTMTILQTSEIFWVGVKSYVVALRSPTRVWLSTGDRFVLMFPDVGGSRRLPPELVFTTSESAAVSVEVSVPAIGFRRTLTVTNAAPVVQILSANVQSPGIATGKGSKGVLVTASGRVSVQGVNKAVGATDSFLALPVSALGTEYYAVCYVADGDLNQVAVVAAHDGTSVSFVIPANGNVQYNGRTYAAGDTITADLDALDTLQVQSLMELTGLHIYADKPVAAYSGHWAVGDSTPMGNTVTQLAPVYEWGKMFSIAKIRGPERQSAVVRLVSSQSNTDVRFPVAAGGVQSVFMTSPGEYRDIDLLHDNSTAFLVSNKPFQAVLLTKSSNEGTIVPIPAVQQYGSEFIFATPDAARGSFQNLATIMVEKSKKESVLYDSEPVSGLGGVRWVDVAGSAPPMTTGSFPVSVGQHRVYSEDTRFGLIVHGYTAEEAYALPASVTKTILPHIQTTRHPPTTSRRPPTTTRSP